jgi:hypothetical protein
MQKKETFFPFLIAAANVADLDPNLVDSFLIGFLRPALDS